METKDKITLTIAGLAFIFSIINFFLTYRQRGTEDRRSTRKALTDVVSELMKVSIAFSQLDLQYPRSVNQTIVNFRRTFNAQRRYLANHGEFLADQIPELTADIDYVSLAYAFESAGDYEKAQKFYELAVVKSPNNVLKMWNLRGLARFWFVLGNAELGRRTYEEALQLQVPDNDSLRQARADTYLLWSMLEDEHGYVDEAKHARTLGQQVAKRIGNSEMRENMLKMLSGGAEVVNKSNAVVKEQNELQRQEQQKREQQEQRRESPTQQSPTQPPLRNHPLRSPVSISLSPFAEKNWHLNSAGHPDFRERVPRRLLPKLGARRAATLTTNAAEL